MFRLFLALLVSVVGCAGGEMPEDYCDPGPCDEETGLEDPVGEAERGADVFAATCAGCHGADGSGGSGPGLMYLVQQNSDSELAEIILEGEDSMPAQDLTSQEVADVIAFLRDTFGEFSGEDDDDDDHDDDDDDDDDDD